MSRQEEWDTEFAVAIEFVKQLKKVGNNGNTDAGNNQSVFVLIILEKIKEKRPEFIQGSVIVL